MVRAGIVIKSKYLKASKQSSGGSGTYANYIGTREGAVKIAESKINDEPTAAQKELIKEVLEKHKDLKDTLAFEEFNRKPTLGTAKDFIDEAMDQYGEEYASLDIYAKYMSERPGVVKLHSNGLFSDGDGEINLKDVQAELKNYKGNVYTPIISLADDLSHKYEYDNPDAWHKLIERHRDEIAKAYKILPEDFRWVGAYHNAINKNGVEHNHIHLMIWSKNPNNGWQSKETPKQIKKILANDIFKEDYNKLNQELTTKRDSIRMEARDMLNEYQKQVSASIVNGESDLISRELLVLGYQLKDYNGKLNYKYMKPEIKRIVDNITNDMFALNDNLKKSFDEWYDAKNMQTGFYTKGNYQKTAPADLDEFKPIKNAILATAGNLVLEERMSSIDELHRTLSIMLPPGTLSKEFPMDEKELRKILGDLIPYKKPTASNKLTTVFERYLNYKVPKDDAPPEEFQKMYNDRRIHRAELIDALVAEYGKKKTPGIKIPDKKKTQRNKTATMQLSRAQSTLFNVAQHAGLAKSFSYAAQGASMENSLSLATKLTETVAVILENIKIRSAGPIGRGGKVEKLDVEISDEERRRQLALEGHLSM